MKKLFNELKLSLVLIILFPFVFNGPSMAADKETVIWHVSHFPPANILSGTFKGEGFADKTRQFFATRLAEFSHVEQISGFKESMASAADKIPLCRADLLKTPEREKILIFSKPMYFLSGRRLVLKRNIMGEIQEFMNRKGEVDFNRLIASNKIRLSFVHGRSYFVEEPKVFTQYKMDHPQYGFEMTQPSFNAFRDDKVDGLIAYSFEYGYYSRVDGKEKPYRSVRLAGVKPFTHGYMACTKGAFGQKVISKINAIIDAQKEQYPWLEYYKDWVSEDEWMRVERYYARSVAHKN